MFESAEAFTFQDHSELQRNHQLVRHRFDFLFLSRKKIDTIQSCMTQMSGGDFTMDYDQERAYFKMHCMDHDVLDMFRVLSDCALEDRTPMAINVLFFESRARKQYPK